MRKRKILHYQNPKSQFLDEIKFEHFTYVSAKVKSIQDNLISSAFGNYLFIGKKEKKRKEANSHHEHSKRKKKVANEMFFVTNVQHDFLTLGYLFQFFF